MDKYLFTFDLSLRSGPIVFPQPKGLGDVILSCWFSAIRWPGMQPANKGTIVFRKDERLASWDFQTTPDVADAVLHGLTTLGLPQRKPRVAGVVDTADIWHELVVRFQLWDDSMSESTESSFHLLWQCSGFEGEDAASLRAVFRSLLTAAGVSSRETDFQGLTR